MSFVGGGQKSELMFHRFDAVLCIRFAEHQDYGLFPTLRTVDRRSRPQSNGPIVWRHDLPIDP